MRLALATRDALELREAAAATGTRARRAGAAVSRRSANLGNIVVLIDGKPVAVRRDLHPTTASPPAMCYYDLAFL